MRKIQDELMLTLSPRIPILRKEMLNVMELQSYVYICMLVCTYLLKMQVCALNLSREI